MSSCDNKTKQNKDSQRPVEERPRWRRPDALSLLSSLVSFDDVTDAQTPRLASPLPINLKLLQSQPLPLGLMRERDESVRRTLSQDWLKERFSPRPRSDERGPFARKSSSHATLGPLLCGHSLASIAEDENDEDSEVSGDLPHIAEDEICDKTRVLSISEDVSTLSKTT